jgi:hypothetical protein
MKYVSIWTVTLLVVTTLKAASSQEPQMLAEPPEIIDPPWIESRRQAQLAIIDQFEVFCDFKFSDQIARSGIHFYNKVVDDSGKYWQPVHYDHGNGVAVADVNGDGLYDIYFTNQVGSNQLWKNKGDGTFEDGTAAAGVGLAEPIGVTASFADTDNDGDPDLYVTTIREAIICSRTGARGASRTSPGHPAWTIKAIPPGLFFSTTTGTGYWTCS